MSLDLENLPLSSAHRERVGLWLTDPMYRSERQALEEVVRAALAGDSAAVAELEDAFSGPLPIGTGGRRGPCGPGPNRMNTVVLRETAHGLASAMREHGDVPRVAVVYDTRHSSREFAYLVAAQLAAEGLEVILVDGPRSTPLLSFLVRSRGCGAGIVISASHNPPPDNGIKIYGPDGAQVLGARDRAVMRCIEAAMERPDTIAAIDIEAIARFELVDLVERIDPTTDPDTIDVPYCRYVASQGVLAREGDGGVPLVVTFSPLHGVGHHAVVPVLREAGFTVHPVPAQCDPDGGRFSTVKSANPESPSSLDMVVSLAKDVGADLALATDPDADRLGASVRDRTGAYHFIDGNRLGVLMLDHVLRQLGPESSERAAGWVLTTMVSSPLLAAICRKYGVEIVDDLLVGFKHHAGMMAESDRPLLLACEESHGFLRGGDIRDKDGAIAALLLSECAAIEKARGQTLLDRLDAIWAEHGYFKERTESLYARGAAGRESIAGLMVAWRETPPRSLAGLELVSKNDRLQPRSTGSATRDLPGDVVCFEYAANEQRCRLVLRPSGTEPKVKIYALAQGRASSSVDRLVKDVVLAASEAAKRVMDVPRPQHA